MALSVYLKAHGQKDKIGVSCLQGKRRKVYLKGCCRHLWGMDVRSFE